MNLLEFVKKIIVDFVKAMLSDLDINERKSVIQYLLDFLKYLKNKLSGNTDIVYEISRLEDSFNRMLSEAVQTQKNTAENSSVKYSLNVNAKSELHKALYDTNYRNEVLLRDVTPPIMLSQKGVENRPMVMNASHIRENVFTEDEARKLGLKVDGDKHYHGLGEDFFLKIIDGLDNVKEAYRGTRYANMPSRRENYFLLVSEFKGQDGNTINVPVYIEEGAQCNRVYLKSNKIATVFGKDNFRSYINNQVKNKNLVRIKNKSNKISEGGVPLTPAYENIAPIDNRISQNEPTVNNNSMQEGSNNSKNIKFSFARSNDTSLVAQAEQMENDGARREEIWEELGLTRDTGGVWIYEIDDSDMVFYPNGDALVKDAAPVTYDDNGNIISLDQRFDSSKKDIRYSMPRYVESKESAFSMPSEAVVMFNKLQAGQITDDEYEYFMDELWDKKKNS